MKYLLMATAACAVTVVALAQNEPANSGNPPPSPPPPCQDHVARAFDFWLGEWDVVAAGNDQPTAINRISSAHNGCVILEQYQAGQFTGMSMSFYDAPRKTWHQTWMANGGRPLYLEGGLTDAGAMRMTDEALPSGKASGVTNRVTWTPNDDGTVRQLWDQTKDGGDTWSVVFDGTYQKRGVGPANSP